LCHSTDKRAIPEGRGSGGVLIEVKVLPEFSGDFSLDDLRGKKRARKLLERN
jgi:hypothetical protein